MARKHAIVMGASMAGLMATRALSDHFERVTVIEQDTLPEAPENRRGVPQGRHTHGLLAGGRQEMERVFPGVTREMVDAGALAGDIVRDFRWFFEGGCLAQVASGMDAVAASRPFIESFIRRRAFGLKNVTSRQACQVEGLLATEDRGRVSGVRVDGETLAADLVVDATGRGSKMPQWLKDLGYEAAEEERVEISLKYTTRYFRRDARELGGDLGTVTPPTAAGKRGGVMIAQEGGRWTVTLICHFGPHAPEDLAGFIAWAGTLPAPYIHEVIRKAEPLGDATQAGMPASVRRRYEKLARFPEGLLVTGDAVCSFNPIYGQGMTVAAQYGRELNEALAEGEQDLARRFFARAARAADNPWTIAVGNDLRMPETVGPRNAGVNAVNWYMSKLHRAAHTDAELALAFHRVANLLAPPPSVMQPRLALRVLGSGLFGGGEKARAAGAR
ncbi:MAG: FAD-dependent monooxygenase [Acidobacteriota bacterium]